MNDIHTKFNIQNREALLDLFMPQEGYRISSIVGTTFSLDLKWLLTLMIQGYESKNKIEDEPAITSLLNAIREYGKKCLVFFEKGQIVGCSRGSGKIQEFLKNCVVQIPAIRGTFHPKVWLIRYEAQPGAEISDNTIKYKLFVMSRNAVFSKATGIICHA